MRLRIFYLPFFVLEDEFFPCNELVGNMGKRKEAEFSLNFETCLSSNGVIIARGGLEDSLTPPRRFLVCGVLHKGPVVDLSI